MIAQTHFSLLLSTKDNLKPCKRQPKKNFREGERKNWLKTSGLEEQHSNRTSYDPPHKNNNFWTSRRQFRQVHPFLRFNGSPAENMKQAQQYKHGFQSEAEYGLLYTTGKEKAPDLGSTSFPLEQRFLPCKKQRGSFHSEWLSSDSLHPHVGDSFPILRHQAAQPREAPYIPWTVAAGTSKTP